MPKTLWVDAKPLFTEINVIVEGASEKKPVLGWRQSLKCSMEAIWPVLNSLLGHATLAKTPSKFDCLGEREVFMESSELIGCGSLFSLWPQTHVMV